MIVAPNRPGVLRVRFDPGGEHAIEKEWCPNVPELSNVPKSKDHPNLDAYKRVSLVLYANPRRRAASVPDRRVHSPETRDRNQGSTDCRSLRGHALWKRLRPNGRTFTPKSRSEVARTQKWTRKRAWRIRLVEGLDQHCRWVGTSFRSPT